MNNVTWRFCNLAACALPIFLSGCADFGNYSNSFGRLDQAPQHIPASIQVSTPQLYKREALINERREELSYLQKKLTESETITFGSELVRDIESISALSAQLGLSFDAGIKQKVGQATQLSDLENQISMVKLQAQLGQLQRDLQLMQSSYADQTKPSVPAGTSATTTTVPTITPPSLPDINNLTALVQKLTDRLDKSSVAPRPTSATSSPIDVFQDRQAYRRVLQSAINAASLDDLHDFEGHSLFRIQFHATVLPGDEKVDKSLGILRMKIKHPELSIKAPEVDALYYEWLDHVTLRLNEIKNGGVISIDPTLLMLSSTNELFSVIWLNVSNTANPEDCKGSITLKKPPIPDSKCLAFPIAIPLIDGLRNTSKDKVVVVPETSTLLSSFKFRSDLQLFEFQSGTQIKNISSAARSSCDANNKLVIALGNNIVASSNRLKLLASRVISNMENSNVLITNVDNLINAHTQLADKLKNDCEPISIAITDDKKVPETFYRALFNAPQKDIGSNVFAAHGRPSAYAVTPVELAQHISSAARAGTAVQMAASLAAILPTQGIGANGALGYSRSAIGKADALERVPLVVGYSEPDDKYLNIAVDNNGQDTLPGFGWLLGPKVVFDPQNKALALEHNLAPYDLTADVVMPGWWPYFDIQYQSEWAPNWLDGNGVSKFLPEKVDQSSNVKRGNTRTMRVPRRHSRGDLDSITMLALKQLGTPRVEIAAIGHVEPSIVSGCAKQVTMLVQGTNIWRTQAAYLAGLPASKIDVLPDMVGVSVVFDISQLPQRPVKFTQSQLTLTTPNGWASTDISIDGSRLAAKGCGDEGLAQSPPPDEAAPTIKSVLPATLYACDKNQRLLVQGKKLEDIQDIHLGPIPIPKPTGGYKLVGKDLEVTIDSIIGNTGGSQATLPLIITTAKGTASKDVAIERDDPCPATVNTSHPVPANTASKAVLRQVALLPIPAGRLDICAKQATLLLTGSSAMKIDGATLTMTKPKAVTITAQSVKTLQGQNMAEINFVGLPSQGTSDSSTVDSSVQIQLYRGAEKGPLISVDATCAGSDAAVPK